MKANNLKIFGIILAFLTISSILSIYYLGNFLNDIDKGNTEKKYSFNEKKIDSIGFSEFKINDIIYELSSFKIREERDIEFIIKWKNLDSSKNINLLLESYDIEIYKEIPSINSSLIYATIDLNQESIEKFVLDAQNIPGVVYIEPSLYDNINFVPNDSFYSSNQWDLPLIGMESAWNYQLGVQNVLVAVIDSGIDYTHPDLSGNYVSLGYDWVNNDNDPMDDLGHGTHCAGIIAATINNDMGIAGMAQVSIFAEKCLNADKSGSHADFKSAVIHAVDNGAQIISYSAGGSHSITKQEGVDYAISNGVILIAAAGNKATSTPFYPAAYADVIAVSATDQNDQLASFSNYGIWIDVAAPGVGILSTLPGNSYDSRSGTSMATPHVAGLAALIKSQYPSYTSDQIETIIYSNVVDLGDPGFDIYYGHGRIDASSIFINTPPDIPSNHSPSNGEIDVSVNPTLKVEVSDPNGDMMTVYFYNASKNSLIGTDIGIASGGTASIPFSGLSEGITYSWYVVVDDGLTTTNSSVWSFTTYSENPVWDEIPSDQIIKFGDEFSYDVNASDLSDIDYYWINDTINFVIDGNGTITNAVTLSIGFYWLEIRAYDPYENYCTITIKITVKMEDIISSSVDTDDDDKDDGDVIFLFSLIGLITIGNIISSGIIGSILFLKKKRKGAMRKKKSLKN